MKGLKYLLFAGAVAAAGAQPARAAFISGIVDVKFDGTTNGAAVIGSAGDTWNNNGTTGQSLNTTAGASSGASLGTVGSGGHYESGGSNGPNTTLTGTYIYNTATTAGSSGLVTVNGLDTTGFTAYNLYVYEGANSQGRPTTYQVAGLVTSSDVVTNPGTTDAGSWVSSSGGTQGNYYEFASVAPNGSGTITINFYGSSTDPSGKHEGDFAGLQIQAVPVPEPASLGLLGASALALLSRRGRRIGSTLPVAV